MSIIPNGAIPVLNHGYVLLTRLSHDVHYDEGGALSLSPSTELGVVADARVSTDRSATEFGKKEAGTLNFLLREDHTSPFRGTVLQFEVKAPLFIARQWWKYVVGHEHDESSTPCPFVNQNERCIPASQGVSLFQRGQITAGELYERFMSNPSKMPLVRSVDAHGEIVRGVIKDVWKTGSQKVYRVTSSAGNSVMTTANHRYAVDINGVIGYKPLSELSTGDKVYMNGVPAYKNKAWLENQYVTLEKYQYQIAEEVGCTHHTIRKWVRIHGLQQSPTGRMHKKNREHGVFGKGLTARELPILRERGIKSSASRDWANNPYRGEAHHCWKGDSATTLAAGHYRARKTISRDSCYACGSTVNVEIHHKNKNELDNRPENLVALCVRHHQMAHGKNTKLAAHLLEIASIELVGEEEVYDIQMTGEPNFVASNFVIHNSFRYTEAENEFYRPKLWRQAPEKRAQGSGGEASPRVSLSCDWRINQAINEGCSRYDAMITDGVCAEQARLVLPAYALYTTWRWTCSLQGLCHFLSQRLAHDAQSEIREYAEAVKLIARPLFPSTIDAMGKPKGAA